MPIKVGNSYVSEAALAYAQNKVAEDKKSGNLLNDLSKQFTDVKFSVGMQPFNGTGLNNISIAPNILRQTAENPDKRLEYEALIYDCNQGLKDTANRPGLKAQGYIIGSDGGLRMWAISQSDDGKNNRSIFNVDKDKLAGRLPKKKKSPIRKLQDKLLNKSNDKNADTENATSNGKTTVTFNESKRSRQLAAAQTVDEVQQVMELLKTDLEDCENGLQNGWCDEAEVAKVKKMIERAQKRINEVDDAKSDTFDAFSINMLI